MRRTLPTRSAFNPESGNGPMRTATSMPFDHVHHAVEK
jgi:hypothetical protein